MENRFKVMLDPHWPSVDGEHVSYLVIEPCAFTNFILYARFVGGFDVTQQRAEEYARMLNEQEHRIREMRKPPAMNPLSEKIADICVYCSEVIGADVASGGRQVADHVLCLLGGTHPPPGEAPPSPREDAGRGSRSPD